MHLKQFALGAALCVIMAAEARPAAIRINGVCKTGDCTSITPGTATLATSIGDGESDSGTFDYDITVNGDDYNVSGSYAVSYSAADGSQIQVNPTITYTGSTPTGQTDTIAFDFFQNYFDPGPGTWAGTYNEAIPLELDAQAGSTIQAQLLYDGQSVGLAGPFGPGIYFVANSSDLDFGGDDTSAYLSTDFFMQVAFAAGTVNGDQAISPAPEPATALPCALALLGTVFAIRRRR